MSFLMPFFKFLLERGSLIGLKIHQGGNVSQPADSRFTKDAKLVSQLAPGVLLSLPPFFLSQRLQA